MNANVVSRKERTCVFHVRYFIAKQNTSCSGQKGQIISLESVIEERVRVKQKEVGNRDRSV